MKPCAYEMILDAYRACLTSSMNLLTSPTHEVFDGPFSTLLAFILSFFNEDKHLENTDSPINVTGIPQSSAEMAVHLPVPKYNYKPTLVDITIL